MFWFINTFWITNIFWYSDKVWLDPHIKVLDFVQYAWPHIMSAKLKYIFLQQI